MALMHHTSSVLRPFNIAFFGTDHFAIPSLKKLVQKFRENKDIISELTVITPPDATSGRGHKILKPAPIKLVANELGLAVHHPPPKKFGTWELPPSASNRPYDLAIAVSFGYFIPKRILAGFTYGGVNVHPSLLPKYRGAAPLLHTLWNGDSTTGVTVQELSVQSFDAGRILNQCETPVSPNEDYLTLHDRLSEKGAQMLVNTLERWEYFQANGWEQDPTKVSHSPKLDRTCSFVNWESDSPELIMRRYLSLGWRYPVSSYFRGSVIQLFGLSIVANQKPPKCPGTLSFDLDNKAILVNLADSRHLLRATHVKMANKSKLEILDFINGYHLSDSSNKLTTEN